MSRHSDACCVVSPGWCDGSDGCACRAGNCCTSVLRKCHRCVRGDDQWKVVLRRGRIETNGDQALTSIRCSKCCLLCALKTGGEQGNSDAIEISGCAPPS